MEVHFMFALISIVSFFLLIVATAYFFQGNLDIVLVIPILIIFIFSVKIAFMSEHVKELREKVEKLENQINPSNEEETTTPDNTTNDDTPAD
jgi:c-di-AMP phosphodiesterase-like protein